MHNFKVIGLVALLGVFTAQVGLAAKKHPAKKAAAHTEEKKDTLYNRLGGKDAITTVVNNFVGKCAADTRINKFFAATASDPKRLGHFKNSLVDQICEASGGPCKYKGKDMKSAHANMNIAEADFNALVEDLSATLDEAHVAAADKNTLLGVLGPMKGDIVTAGETASGK